MDQTPATRSTDAVAGSSSERWTSHALEWGVASILIGVLILVAASLGAIAAAVGLSFHFAQARGSVHFINDVRETFTVIMLAILLVLLLAAIGFAFGTVGLRRAWSRKLPAGIPAAGATICGFVISIAVVALVVTLLTRQGMLKTLEQERQEELNRPGKSGPGIK